MDVNCEFFSNDTLVKAEQDLKALLPILVIVFGISTFNNFVQPLKALLPMVVTLNLTLSISIVDGISIDVCIVGILLHVTLHFAGSTLVTVNFKE